MGAARAAERVAQAALRGGPSVSKHSQHGC